MRRLGCLIVVGALATGCSTSRKVVVQDGYPGISQTPPGFEPKRPGALTLAPSAPTGGSIGTAPAQPAIP